MRRAFAVSYMVTSNCTVLLFIVVVYCCFVAAEGRGGDEGGAGCNQDVGAGVLREGLRGILDGRFASAYFFLELRPACGRKTPSFFYLHNLGFNYNLPLSVPCVEL